MSSGRYVKIVRSGQIRTLSDGAKEVLVARRRSPLEPEKAKSEGQRLLMEILRRQTFGAIARRHRCDEGTIRHYARGDRKPIPIMRDRMSDNLGIPFDAWDEPASTDLYAAGEDPATTRRT